MGYRELSRMDIVEVIRRWQVGAIARGSGVARKTVKKYLRAAEKLGLAANGPPLTEDQVVQLVHVGRVVTAPRVWASPEADRLEPYGEQITAWLQEEHLQFTRVQELLGQRGLHVPYSTLERFVWRLGLKPRGRRGDTACMAPTPPGEVAEMDFERLGLLFNPETGCRQWIWGLSITLTAGCSEPGRRSGHAEVGGAVAISVSGGSGSIGRQRVRGGRRQRTGSAAVGTPALPDERLAASWTCTWPR
jgi:hypothetical protein